jgi:trehalose-phosphatase
MLAHQSNITISAISGRAISDLKNLIQVNGIIYAGNHGMEIEGPGINYLYPLSKDVEVIFRTLYRVLDRVLSGIPGVIIEDKGLTFSVHYRQVDRNQVQEVKNIFDHSVGGLSAANKVKITTGKEVLEVRPAIDWNKGKAVKLLMKRSGNASGKNNVVPIYLGDDLTDEDAFGQINKYNSGITVFVGNSSQVTRAHYYLNSPDEVALFLKRTLELFGR